MSKARDLADGTFDTDTLVVDAANNRVGIGTASPSSLNVNYNNLVVGSGSGNEGITIYSGTSSYGGLIFADGTAGTAPYEGQLKYDHASNSMSFHTNGGSERMRILSSGGITFNGDTASANALDDYEEGTWTPRWGGTTSDGSVTYNVQNGYYTKVGRLVTLRGTIGITAISTSPSGYLLVKGLPFYNLSGSETVGSIGYGSCFTSGTFPDAIHVSNGSTSCYLYYSSSQGSPMVNSNTGSTLTTGVLYFAITYQAN